MKCNTKSSLGLAVSVLFCGALLAGLSLGSRFAAAQKCPVAADGSGMCRTEGNFKCSPPTGGYCYSTHNHNEWTCICATTKPVTRDTPYHHGPNINIGIGVGPGGGIGIGIGPEGGGIGFDFSTGGYCDRWGCPGDYWGYPVFYGPVYFDGEWFEGPVYYREYDGEYEYWVHGNWHRDEWRGERPDWARDVHYGPALGHDYYRSDEFRHDADRYHHGDHPDRSEGDHHTQPEAGVRWDHDHGDHHKGDQGDHPKDDKGDHHGAGDSGDH
jgi:hypothetical protein